MLIARAELEVERGDRAPAEADLDAADAAGTRQADVRFQMADVYQQLDRLTPAVVQLSLWIESHADDARMPMALNSRCRLRALADTELPLALKDCNAASRGVDKATALYARIADSRGLVYLRMTTTASRSRTTMRR